MSSAANESPIQPGVKVLASVGEVMACVGQTLGVGAWHRVDQARIDQFAAVSGDRQWIHVDPVRAAQGPYGRCVAHGLLTLSLAGGSLFHEVVQVRADRGINYGCDRVRYPAPVLVDARIRGHAHLSTAQPIDPLGVQMGIRLTVEVEGADKPACVADFVVRFYFQETSA